jgi:hypothetical protein
LIFGHFLLWLTRNDSRNAGALKLARRFSLRTLLIATTLVAVVLGLIDFAFRR